MKRFSFIGRCLTESLTTSTSAFVCVLLAVPLTDHATDLSYILPVMLFYACMKSGLYLLHSLVHIENPYKMMKYSIILAFIGSFFLLNGNPSSSCYLVGSVVTGIGLMPVSSLYKFISTNDEESKEKPLLRQIISTAVLVFLATYCIICKKHKSCGVLHFWSVYLGIICLYVIFLPAKWKYTSKKTVVLKDRWFIHSIPAVFLFFMMAAVSGYKSSGNTLIFALMIVSLVFFLVWNKIFADRKLYKYCAQTSWLGALRGFEMLFALVFLVNTHQNNFTIIVYEVVVAASFFGFIPNMLLGKYDSKRTVIICMFVSLLCMLLVISRNVYLMLIGIFFCVCFTNKGKLANLKQYQSDSSVIQDEYYLRQDKMFSLGNATIQAYTMIIFYVVGKLISGHGNEFMQSYVFKFDMNHGGATLLISGLVCVLSLFIFLIAILKMPDNPGKQ